MRFGLFCYDDEEDDYRYEQLKDQEIMDRWEAELKEKGLEDTVQF